MYSFSVHKLLDYWVAASVAVLAMTVANVHAAYRLFLWAAAARMLYTLVTRGEFSPLKVLPFWSHMALDVALAVAFLVGPWLFRYRSALTAGQLAIHIWTGLGFLAMVALTNRRRAPVWDTEVLPIEDVREQEQERQEALRDERSPVAAGRR